jgi:hypothetical protein
LKKLVSALPLLQPVDIYNTKTGETVTIVDLNHKINSLLTYCYEEAVAGYSLNEEKLGELFTSRPNVTAPAEFARQNNIHCRRNLPVAVKAQSRVEKLVQYKIVSEASSYTQNLNPNKRPFTFSQTVNLGAVDKQMVTLSKDGNQLNLLWKCWDAEYLLVFNIPAYILKRNIIKFTLPTVSRKGFIFNILEETPTLKTRNHYKAGLDLGRNTPYVIAVINSNNNRVAHYTTSKTLTRTNNRRDNLIQEKKHLNIKILAYTQLGLNVAPLTTERDHKTGKITRLGQSLAQQLAAEITKKLAKHKLNTLNVEDLRWATGAKYGSRWNHSKQQEALTHSLLRVGIQVKKINPKNTSQECHKCDTKLIHNTKKRTVHCVNCKATLDRDFNAAMKIAAKQCYPVSKRENGDNFSSILGQVVELTVHNRLNKQEKQLT